MVLHRPMVLHRMVSPTRLRAAALLVGLAALGASMPTGAQAPAGSPGDQEARAILQKADEIRFPSEPFEVGIHIRNVEGEQAIEAREYRILSKGNDNTIVMTLEPATERGQILLMKGRDLWMFLPSVSQPVRLSLAQRLTGLVANGDLARANFVGDYTPQLLGTEKIADQVYYVLDLTAVDRSVTYQRVKYWVRQSNYFPYKAEFYSLSDRLVKTCTYDNFRQLAGRMRPARLLMVDALRAESRSVMEYDQMKVRDLPDKIFTKDYLKKLQ
jgi:outer membrane lipoprotein-sorting protein